MFMIYKPLDEHEDTCFWNNLILFSSVEICKSMREISSQIVCHQVVSLCFDVRIDQTYYLSLESPNIV